jgi:hypothetical protein
MRFMRAMARVMLGLALAFAWAGCSSTPAIVVGTPSVPCATSATPSAVMGVVQQLNPSSATIVDMGGTPHIVHYAKGMKVEMLTPVAASTLAPGLAVQVLTTPTSTGGYPTASVILIPSGQTAFKCSIAAQGVSSIQGTLSTVNPTAQQLTLTDVTHAQFVLALVAATIIGQRTPAQLSDVQQGVLVFGIGTMTADGIAATNFIILASNQS